MRIRWSRLDLRLRHPFVTAAARRTDKQTLLIEVEHGGIRGFGEAAPADFYGQSLESAERTIAEMQPTLEGADPTDIEGIVQQLVAGFDGQRATIAAVDAALHDWNGKAAGHPTVILLDLDPDRAPPTSMTLGLDTPERTREKMGEIAEFPIWKVKIGTETEQRDLEVIRQFAPRKVLRVDANMGWRENAAERLRRVAQFDVEFVEQPCPREDLAAMRSLKDLRICPIVADECCVRPADVERVASSVDGINIKLSKCGGITEGRRMIALARAAGLRVMLGCMIESSLGIAAAAQLAPLADWIDLDGHLLLASDPFEGLGGAGGRLTIGAGPGLGVRRRSETA